MTTLLPFVFIGHGHRFRPRYGRSERSPHLGESGCATVAALAAAGHETPHVLVEGYSYGSLSMTCVAAGMDEQPAAPPGTNVGDRAGAPRLGSVPPDQSNI